MRKKGVTIIQADDIGQHMGVPPPIRFMLYLYFSFLPYYSMTYIEDTDELITGGHGCLQAWKMTHAEVGLDIKYI